jgi:hypothetical protein
MIRITNPIEFSNGLNAWFEETLHEVEAVFRGYTIKVFGFVALETPQYQGTVVMNWKYSVGSPEVGGGDPTLVTRARDKGVDPLHKGEAEAIDYAAGQNSSKPDEVKFDDGLSLPAVYIVNALTDDYVARIESSPDGFLRPVNLPGHMLERAANLYGDVQIDSNYASRLQRARMTFGDFELPAGV